MLAGWTAYFAAFRGNGGHSTSAGAELR